MKNHFQNKLLLALYLLLSSLASLVAQAADEPDISGFWTVKFEQTPSGTELFEKLPEDAIFINDAGGGELAEGDFGGIELTESALQEVRDYDFDYEFSMSYTCMAPSAVFYMQAPFPMEIDQGRDIIVFRMEYFDMVRVIYLDGRGHPGDDYPHSKNGHSIGHWEGDELVVDSTHFVPSTFMNNGFNHSDDIHMVERFKISEDGETLWLTQVYEDPAVFAGKASRYMAWRKVPGENIYPYDCDPSFGR
ncbi:MAG: hypothetical protein HOK55_05690 [Gammaproteobacteria bacterium]|jgi:hypothetical protein|nr:hypothetical protein [Gammaproteobacteria bacterium]